jgi:hypothetical protein
MIADDAAVTAHFGFVWAEGSPRLPIQPRKRLDAAFARDLSVRSLRTEVGGDRKR